MVDCYILPKHWSCRMSTLGSITLGSNITPLCSLLHTLLKDKCMCLQDECNIEILLSPAAETLMHLYVLISDITI